MKKEIQPHQARVVVEYHKLDQKFQDLTKFVEENPMFGKLPGEESHLLKLQLSAMSSYHAVLRSRLALWGIKPDQGMEARDAGLKEITLVVPDTSEAGCESWREKTGFSFEKICGPPMSEKSGQVNPKEAIIRRAKELRVAIDTVLQDVKAFGKDCQSSPCIDNPHAEGFDFFLDPQEVPANVKLCQRHLEDAAMRLGMCLKAVGTPNPYPNSYNPENTTVEPTADGLKL